MRKIQVISWKAINEEGKEIEENLVTVLSILINNKDPKDMPKGLENFRLMNRLVKAFDSSKDSHELILDDKDYTFLKNAIENDIPSQWGANKDVMKAVEDFLEAKSV